MLEQCEKLQEDNEWLRKKVIREREECQISEASLNKLIYSKEID
jgi:hypothetical protein